MEKELHYTFKKEFKASDDEDIVVMNTKLFNDEFNFECSVPFSEGIRDVIKHGKNKSVCE